MIGQNEASQCNDQTMQRQVIAFDSVKRNQTVPSRLPYIIVSNEPFAHFDRHPSTSHPSETVMDIVFSLLFPKSPSQYQVIGCNSTRYEKGSNQTGTKCKQCRIYTAPNRLCVSVNHKRQQWVVGLQTLLLLRFISASFVEIIALMESIYFYR